MSTANTKFPGSRPGYIHLFTVTQNERTPQPTRMVEITRQYYWLTLQLTFDEVKLQNSQVHLRNSAHHPILSVMVFFPRILPIMAVYLIPWECFLNHLICKHRLSS